MWMKSIGLAAMLATFSIAAAYADEHAYARTDTVLRSEPESSAHVVSRVPANAELRIGHCTDNWCYAHLGEKSGYVKVAVLDFEDTGHTVIERTYVEPTYVYPGPYYGPGFYCCGLGWHRPYWRR